MDYQQLATRQNLQFDSIDFAQWLDNIDPLGWLRDEFDYPTFESLEKMTKINFVPEHERSLKAPIYLCGHSLGLPPKQLLEEVRLNLHQWGGLGVYAYHSGPLPASFCDSKITEDVAQYIVGAEVDEVAITANLSVNMHMLLARFYRPIGSKSCILIEEGSFPTDYYVIESQMVWHGLNPKDHIIVLRPRSGEWCLRTEDIIQTIKENAHRLALIWLPGIQFVTGEVFDIARITKAAHELAECCIGWDLAHSVGNVPLELHAWDVDIAVWCSYKYLNGSPGAIGGLFVHTRHHHVPGIHGPEISKLEGPQLTGWWSHRTETRFDFTGNMELARGAQAYRISNPPMLLATALQTSLNLFKRCGGISEVRKKSTLLTGYLEYLLEHGQFALPASRFSIITPKDTKARGAQLTLYIPDHLQNIFNRLTSEGFITDIRKPNCMRIAPVALYNRFEDVFHFAKRLHGLATELKLIE